MRIDSQFIDDEKCQSLGIPGTDREYFQSLCKRIYTTLLSFPSPSFCFYRKDSKEFYLSIGSNSIAVPYNTNISEYDFSEILYTWAYKFFPGYMISKSVERNLTPEEIASQVLSGKRLDDIINSKAEIQKVEKFKIEKIVIRDDQVNVKLDGKRFILISRADMPISEFIHSFRRIKDDYEKAAFVNMYTKKILEVSSTKNVEIRYTGEKLLNFFRVRCISMPDPFRQVDGLTWRWGRFIIYFPNQNMVEEAKDIISSFNKKEGLDNYLKTHFKAEIHYKKLVRKEGDRNNV